MNDSRQQRVFRIFDDAQQLDPSRRLDFVSRTSEGDDDLHAEVIALLEAADASGEFMVAPALECLAHDIAQAPWTLQVGETIGPYTIVELLGSGGAGEVWRARDERLRRDVAIKVLLPHVADDGERLRQFADEARVAGALNHANILTVYDVGEHEGVPYLVCECLEGRSLRQRLNQGPVTAEEGLAIARGIVRGLAAAHARSIVHRDLKPENTFLTDDGSVKILDFGLARLQMSLEGEPSSSERTIAGVIVGTAGYIAPEQIQQQNSDARADLFALGVMLYEMLAGDHPFRRANTFETLHAVLTCVPSDVSSRNSAVPSPLARIAMRLLEKNPASRFQSASDLSWALDQVGPATLQASVPAAAATSMPWWRSRSGGWAAALIVAALTLSAAIGLGQMPARGVHRPPLTRFTWHLPAGVGLRSAPVVSPDGGDIAFVGESPNGNQLYVRSLGADQAVAIPGTDGAMHPFWSPDGGWLGFFANGRLMKVQLRGGAPTPLADALFPFGGAWNTAGTIVFAPDVIMAGLLRVRPGGGTPEPATVLEASLGDTSHGWPVFLGDGVHFLYFVRSANDERRGIYLGRIDEPAAHARTPVLQSDSNPIYVPPQGNDGALLLYIVDGRIEARRLDSARLTLSPDARAVGLIAAGTTLSQPAMLSASADVLVYASSAVPYGGSSRLEAVDRRGQRVRFWPDAEAQNWPSLSPDGRYLLRERVDDVRNTPDLWVEDLESGAKVRITTAVEPDLRPVWSPDGRQIAYVTGNLPFRPGKRMLHIAAADGSGVISQIPCPGEYCEPTDWTSEGLLVNVIGARRRDVWVIPTAPGAPSRPLLGEAFDERDARMSRDGKWIAYVSSESGRPEVSVRSIRGERRRIPISTDGGDHPVWRRDNAEVFYIDTRGQLRSVAVAWKADGEPQFGVPETRNVPPIGRGHWGTPYDVSADGNRIYFLRRNDDPLPQEIHVVMGWRRLLE